MTTEYHRIHSERIIRTWSSVSRNVPKDTRKIVVSYEVLVDIWDGQITRWIVEIPDAVVRDARSSISFKFADKVSKRLSLKVRDRGWDLIAERTPSGMCSPSNPNSYTSNWACVSARRTKAFWGISICASKGEGKLNPRGVYTLFW